MKRDEILRENLIALLTGEYARASFNEVVAEFPMERINEHFPNADYTPWALLEHIRTAQQDILDFIKNPDYREKEWPKDFWPRPGLKATTADWQKTIKDYKKDFNALLDIVKDPKTELFKGIPWGEGITVLREIVTVANHNAFHLGEFAIMRQAMGTWNKGHRK